MKTGRKILHRLTVDVLEHVEAFAEAIEDEQN